MKSSFSHIFSNFQTFYLFAMEHLDVHFHYNEFFRIIIIITITVIIIIITITVIIIIITITVIILIITITVVILIIIIIVVVIILYFHYSLLKA